MIVLKFGGTSVGSARRMQALPPLIAGKGLRIVVLSAMAGTTNALVAVAAALHAGNKEEAASRVETLESDYRRRISELYTSESGHAKGKDLVDAHFHYLDSFVNAGTFSAADEKKILAVGELLSTAMVQYYLEEIGVASVLLPALELMRTDRRGEPDLGFIEESFRAALARYPDQSLFITQGYICRDVNGEIDNLQRGGSDYTATLIGAALGAEEIQIWTDIDGMHNNDPRVVDRTYPLTELSFDEAAELAYFGASILHPTCVLPAQSRGVPVRILNTMQPESTGTLITARRPGERITAVAAKDGITVIKIKSARMLLAYGFLRSVFEVFERYRTPIDMIVTSEVAVSLTIDNIRHLDEIVEELRSFGTLEVNTGQTIICIVGSFTAERTGLASRVFDVFRTVPIRMISYGGSDNNISVLVDTQYKKEALTALNEGLFAIPAEA
jgi:aspartate kinase